MTTEDQIQFIEDLTSAVAGDLIAQAKLFPDSWNGFELRELLAGKFNNERCEMGRKRKADFQNFVNEYSIL